MVVNEGHHEVNNVLQLFFDATVQVVSPAPQTFFHSQQIRDKSELGIKQGKKRSVARMKLVNTKHKATRLDNCKRSI